MVYQGLQIRGFIYSFIKGLLCTESSAGKEFTCNEGDPSSIPGLGRSPGEWIGYPLQYSQTSLVAQLVKNPPAMWETRVWSMGWEDALEKGNKKVYKALIRLASGGTLHPPSDVCVRKLSLSSFTLIRLCYTEFLRWSSLVSGPKAKSSLEITTPALFTISYQNWSKK